MDPKGILHGIETRPSQRHIMVKVGRLDGGSSSTSISAAAQLSAAFGVGRLDSILRAQPAEAAQRDAECLRRISIAPIYPRNSFDRFLIIAAIHDGARPLWVILVRGQHKPSS